MKKLLLLTTASLLLSTTYAAAEWVSPPRKACTQNGGKLAEGGVCQATWQDAGRICSAAGGSLPSIDELKQVVTDCGGEIGDYDNNRNDPAYQSCYQNKGFSASGYYWSSSQVVWLEKNAWVVYFYAGSTVYDTKTDAGYVRCVRGRQ